MKIKVDCFFFINLRKIYINEHYSTVIHNKQNCTIVFKILRAWRKIAQIYEVWDHYENSQEIAQLLCTFLGHINSSHALRRDVGGAGELKP